MLLKLFRRVQCFICGHKPVMIHVGDHMKITNYWNRNGACCRCGKKMVD